MKGKSLFLPRRGSTLESTARYRVDVFVLHPSFNVIGGSVLLKLVAPKGDFSQSSRISRQNSCQNSFKDLGRCFRSQSGFTGILLAVSLATLTLGTLSASRYILSQKIRIDIAKDISVASLRLQFGKLGKTEIPVPKVNVVKVQEPPVLKRRIENLSLNEHYPELSGVAKKVIQTYFNADDAIRVPVDSHGVMAFHPKPSFVHTDIGYPTVSHENQPDQALSAEMDAPIEITEKDRKALVAVLRKTQVAKLKKKSPSEFLKKTVVTHSAEEEVSLSAVSKIERKLIKIQKMLDTMSSQKVITQKEYLSKVLTEVHNQKLVEFKGEKLSSIAKRIDGLPEKNLQKNTKPVLLAYNDLRHWVNQKVASLYDTATDADPIPASVRVEPMSPSSGKIASDVSIQRQVNRKPGFSTEPVVALSTQRLKELDALGNKLSNQKVDIQMNIQNKKAESEKNQLQNDSRWNPGVLRALLTQEFRKSQEANTKQMKLGETSSGESNVAHTSKNISSVDVIETASTAVETSRAAQKTEAINPKKGIEKFGGQVLEAFGSGKFAVADATVQVLGTDWTTTTDENGYFYFDTAEVSGVLPVVISKSGYLERRMDLRQKQLVECELVSENSLRLSELAARMEQKEGKAFVFGQLESRQKESLYGMQVEFIGKSPVFPIYINEQGLPDQSLRTATDKGQFLLFNVEPGTYVMTVYDPSGKTRAPRIVHLSSNEGLVRKFNLGELKTIRGKVLNPAKGNKPVVGVRVELLGSIQNSLTDNKGRFQLNSVYVDCNELNYLEVSPQKNQENYKIHRIDFSCASSKQEEPARKLYVYTNDFMTALASEVQMPLDQAIPAVLGHVSFKQPVKMQLWGPDEHESILLEHKTVTQKLRGKDFYFSKDGILTPQLPYTTDKGDFIILEAPSELSYIQSFDTQNHTLSFWPIFTSQNTVNVYIQ